LRLTTDGHKASRGLFATAELLVIIELMLFYVDSCGGNLLMNVGPTGDGRIAPIFEERLRQFGSWMSVNEEAVYATRPWHYQNDTVTPYVWYDLHRFYHLPVTLWHAAS